VEDHYYYTDYPYDVRKIYYNVFNNFNELRDYVLSWYYISFINMPEEYLNLLKTTKLDPSFDDNYPIREVSRFNVLKFPCAVEIVKLLLEDERVRSKLTEYEINKYNKIITK
jgi:hypothetical protein